MKALISGVRNIITFIEFIIRIINQILNNTIRVVEYCLAILPKIGTLILTLPPYIQIFGTITIGISVAYLLLGRTHGKSDNR